MRYTHFHNIFSDRISMNIIYIFHLIWHTVILIRTLSLINPCTKHCKSTKKEENSNKKRKGGNKYLHVRIKYLR